MEVGLESYASFRVGFVPQGGLPSARLEREAPPLYMSLGTSGPGTHYGPVILASKAGTQTRTEGGVSERNSNGVFGSPRARRWRWVTLYLRSMSLKRD